MNGLIGALGFLVLGVVELVVAQRTLYPVLRWRHERAKLTQTQGIEPNRVMTLIRFQSLVILPLAGFLLADRLKEMMWVNGT